MIFNQLILKMTACSLVLALLTLSNASVALASTSKIAGEIVVSNRGADVTVNGEVAKTGRAIFSGSTIDTPQDSSAIVSIGSVGRLELAPSTSVMLTFDDKGIIATLASGKVSILSSERQVAINGNLYNAGETVDTGSTVPSSTQTAKSGGSSSGLWILAVLVGGALAAILVASSSSNSSSSGGGTTPISPVR